MIGRMRYEYHQRRKYAKEKNKILRNNTQFQVLHGPFQGLIYPEAVSFGSSLNPKLLGSYEKELHSLLEEIVKNNYSEVINIGCAEGYYAVGLAFRMINSRIYAFDINSRALSFCKKMAESNHVDDRIVLNGYCGPETFYSIRISKKGLIICDCEGFEKELFTENNKEYFKKCDLLIEIHDFIDPGISYYIKSLFQETHSLKTIQSIDDLIKCRMYEYDEIKKLDIYQKRIMLSENRPTIMEWFFLSPIK